MEKSNQFDVRKIIQRLQQARLDLMQTMPFYAILLLQMQFSLDPSCETAYTDGKRIAFDPDFMLNLSDDELNFVLLHEVLHAALSHTNRFLQDYDVNLWNIACDIVVNSIILEANGDDLYSITLKRFGEAMHLAPNGKEGREYSAEEVYRMLLSAKDETQKGNTEKKNGENGAVDGDFRSNISGEGDSEDADSDGDQSEDDESDDGDSGEDDSEEADSEGDRSKGKKSGKRKSRNNGSKGKESDDEAEDDTKGGGSGDNNSQVNGCRRIGATGEGDPSEVNSDYQNIGARTDGGFDDHTYWWLDKEDENEFQQREDENIWLQKMREATTIANKVLSIKDSKKGFGGPPSMVQRMLKELTEPQTDWREVLQDFVQEEIMDYSFNPPDRRFQDSIFLLPDFNEKEISVKNIWFLIDTSGSIGDDAIRAAYSELCAAIDQFDGKLEGWLSFTECFVTEPIPFSSVEDVMEIQPVGGGGNDFSAIFRYMNENMTDDLPAYIIIITDGYDNYPDEREAGGIPVLWLINNEDATPPWGKVARIKV